MAYKKNVPAYTKHSSGQARVRIYGNAVYLGKYGSPESYEQYNRLLAEWMAANGALPTADSTGITIGEVVARYLLWAEKRYRKDGKPTSQVSAIQSSVRPLIRLYKHTVADDFRVQDLSIVRHEMIAKGWTRKSINSHIGRLRTMFKWAHIQLNIAESVHNSLATLPGLRFNEFDVAEAENVEPVSLDVVKRTQAVASKMLADMIEIQLLAGMRPGEVILLRECDINKNGDFWVFKPRKHKLQHLGLVREIELGKRAQHIIEKYFCDDPKSYLFYHPRSGAYYREDSYRRAIHRACDRAWPPAGDLAREKNETKSDWLLRMKITGKWEALQAWHSEHRWSPNQLRHTAGTIIRDKYNLEVAAAVLGHTRVSTTEIYAERSRRTARTAISEMG